MSKEIGKSLVKHQALTPYKPNNVQYMFKPMEIGLAVELLLPKKNIFQPVLYKSLQEGYDHDKVIAHFNDEEKGPKIKEFLKNYSALQEFPPMPDPVYYGYSMYEVDGSYVGDKGRIYDERTQVLKLMFIPDIQTNIKALLPNRFGHEHLLEPTGEEELKIKNWMLGVGLFVFGYLVYNVCEFIEDNLPREQAEEEIWVTSFD